MWCSQASCPCQRLKSSKPRSSTDCYTKLPPSRPLSQNGIHTDPTTDKNGDAVNDDISTDLADGASEINKHNKRNINVMKHLRYLRQSI